MKYYIFLALSALIMLSCSRHSDQWDTLCRVDSYMEACPDSAMSVLQSIDISSLSGDEEKAKYALLLSQALDKNYIDTTDFSVIQPALDYYFKHGSPDEKLKTYYYQGRIYQNKGIEDEAIRCFIRALQYGEKSDDILTKARVLHTQGMIYENIYEWDKSIKAYDLAADYFLQLNRVDSYMNCISCLINVYTLIKDKEKAKYYIDLGLEFVDDCNTIRKGDFYSCYLLF